MTNSSQNPAQTGNTGTFRASLGDYKPIVDKLRDELREKKIIGRLWEHDHTIWRPEPTEITNRLGWLHSPETMKPAIHEIKSFIEQVKADGYTHALLLGMGGSSLAPEVFRVTFGIKEGYLDLAVLDSTDPGAVLAQAERLDMARTLFIVSTKSGGTVETLSFFKYFYNRVVDAVGAEEAGKHFVAITDPGSSLGDLAQKYQFRQTFLNDPNIGGRYSALSYFGLMPAALIGVDLDMLLVRAHDMACDCGGCNTPLSDNYSGEWLGAAMGAMATEGRDKLTLIASPAIASFGIWAEQLVAESTGKEGKGILPVVDEPLRQANEYSSDRFFVYLKVEGDDTHDAAVQALIDGGLPVVQYTMSDLYDLAGEFLRWEIATAVASYKLNINPFDQPNVESAKILAREMVAAYHKDGSLPTPTATLQADGITVYAGDMAGDSLAGICKAFAAQAKPSDYISIQAYVQPTEETTTALQALRADLLDALKLATTVGYGPRFLHSTGQLHKGDAGNGLFIQLTAEDARDADIPDTAGEPASSMTFGVLKLSQALGDRQALLDNNRRLVRFHLSSNVVGDIEKLRQALK